MRRRELSEREWQLIEPYMPGRPGTRGVTGQDNRLIGTAVFYRSRTGIHSLARPACSLWSLEYGGPALPPVGQSGRVAAAV
jgi:transposase